MLIRFASGSDAHAIASLRWESHFEDNENIIENREDYINRTIDWLTKGKDKDNWSHLIIELENKIVGIISIYVFERMPAPSRDHAYNGYITNVYVKKEYRKNGFGKILIRKVKTWAEEMKINVLMLYSSDEAIDFYRREGFTNNNEFFNYILNNE